MASPEIIVMALAEPGGRVSIRICRRQTRDFEADNAPLELTNGTLDIELSPHEMHELASVLTDALWFRSQ